MEVKKREIIEKFMSGSDEVRQMGQNGKGI
jgi:hypothetical protein